MLIRAPGGGEIPLRQAAKIELTDAPARITRVDGARVINVTANVVPGITTGNKVLGSFEKTELPQILKRYPQLRHSFEGEQREQREAMNNLSWGLLASLFAIYAIMASSSQELSPSDGRPVDASLEPGGSSAGSHYHGI